MRPPKAVLRRATGLAVAACLLTLCCMASAEEYRWTTPPTSVLAPSDSSGPPVSGASLQGGLIDLRYGQASIDVGGTGVVLDWNESTVFSLNGKVVSAEVLTKHLETKGGLSVALRYNPKSGQIGWCDAISLEKIPAVDLKLDPWEAVLSSPGLLTVSLPKAESQRLDLKKPTLFAPGMSHSLRFRDRGQALVAELPLMPGWNWSEIPLFVKSESGQVYRAKRVSISSAPPKISGHGPQTVSSHLDTVPAWLELTGPLQFLDPTSVDIQTSPSLRVLDVYPRRNRVDFHLKLDGVGPYWVRARISDRLGRRIEKQWNIPIQP